MSWIGAALCALAAWRLRHSPLLGVAVATAAVNVTVLLWTTLMRARGSEPARAAIALRHVSAALGAFFLFVSFSMR